MSTERVQANWIEFAGALRRELHDQIPRLRRMPAHAVRDFVEACRSASWLERDAHAVVREPWENTE